MKCFSNDFIDNNFRKREPQEKSDRIVKLEKKLRTAIKKLSKRQKQVVRMWLKGILFMDIDKRLKWSSGVASNVFKQAKIKLEKLLKEHVNKNGL